MSTGVSLPCNIFLWPDRRSYTREPVAEFHTFGSPPLLESLQEALCTAGARLAQPGEFTLRAFLAGRIDLSQAEAVLGVIDARDSNQFDTALAQLAGGIASPLEKVRNELLYLLAELEAGLDFVEEDIEFITRSQLLARIKECESQLNAIQTQMDARADSLELPRVVLVGPPNAGKSSLFNRLAEMYATEKEVGGLAIVSSERGTTRDYVTVQVSILGTPCLLVDTAGYETAFDSHSIGSDAQAHRVAQCASADVRVYCCSCDLPMEEPPTPCEIVAITKADLNADSESCNPGAISTSAAQGSGIHHLGQAICQSLANQRDASVVATTATRCRESVRLAHAALASATALADRSAGEELVAAELRQSLVEIGKIVGAVYTDDILDHIFGAFCIGK